MRNDSASLTEGGPISITVDVDTNDVSGADGVASRTFATLEGTYGTLTLNLFDPRLGAWHSLGRPELPNPFEPGQTIAPTGTVEVEAITLDDYAGENRLDRIALLKIDVEGAEPDVIAGAAGLLERGAVGAVLFEVSLPQAQSLGYDPGVPFA